jgi:hypothetical protein
MHLSNEEAEEVLTTFTLPTNLHRAYEGLRSNLRDDLKPSLSRWVLMHNEQECLTVARWFNCPFEDRPTTSSIDEELDYELLSEQHPLFGIKCQPIAYDRENHNEYILLTAKPSMRITLIHLTWSREKKPEYLRVLGFASLAEFAKVMGIDAAEVIRNSVTDNETRL